MNQTHKWNVWIEQNNLFHFLYSFFLPFGAYLENMVAMTTSITEENKFYLIIFKNQRNIQAKVKQEISAQIFLKKKNCKTAIITKKIKRQKNKKY